MTLRDKMADVFVEHGAEVEEVQQVSSPTGALIGDLVETVARWLECDDVRPTIYDGMVAPGPTTKNIGDALARRARGVKEPNDDTVLSVRASVSAPTRIEDADAYLP